MPSLAKTKGWTEEQLLALPDIGHKVELVDGRLEMTPAGAEHGGISVNLVAPLATHVAARKLGRVFESSTGFWMKGGNLRSPDVSFVSAKRLRKLKKLPKGFLNGAPDLVVEVLSPSDTTEKVHEKMVEYFDNGARLGWIVSPSAKTVTVYRDGVADALLKINDTIDGEDVVPGFKLRVKALFA